MEIFCDLIERLVSEVFLFFKIRQAVHLKMDVLLIESNRRTNKRKKWQKEKPHRHGQQQGDGGWEWRGAGGGRRYKEISGNGQNIVEII